MALSIRDQERAYMAAVCGLTLDQAAAKSTSELLLLFMAIPPGGGGGGGGTVTSVNGNPGPSVTLTQDNIADGSTFKQYAQTEKTKLAGIATGATANSADATLLARANHTGSQLSSTISDFTEAAQDAIASLLTSGTQVSLSYNDAGNALTINATGADAETMRDTIGAAIVSAGSLVSIVVNDAGDTITLVDTALVTALAGKASTSHTHDLADVTGFLGIPQLPAGSVVYNYRNEGGGTWPNRPTSRTDLTVVWVGTVAPTVGGTGMLAGVDVLFLAP